MGSKRLMSERALVLHELTPKVFLRRERIVWPATQRDVVRPVLAPACEREQGCSSKPCVSRQRCPAESTNVQRAPSRSNTSRRTAAGICRLRGSAPGDLSGWLDSFNSRDWLDRLDWLELLESFELVESCSFFAAWLPCFRGSAFVPKRRFSKSATRSRMARKWISSSELLPWAWDKSAFARSTCRTYSSGALNCTP